MQREPRADILRPRARHDVAAQRRLHHQGRRNTIAKRHPPHLRRLRVVDGHRLAGDGRGLARVGVALEVDELGAGGAARIQGLAAAALAPAGAVGERDLRSAEASGRGVRLQGALAPLFAVRGEQFRKGDDGVARDAHARRVVLPGVRLDQHREAVTLRKVPGGEARRVHGEQETGSRVVGPGQVRVEGQGHRA